MSDNRKNVTNINSVKNPVTENPNYNANNYNGQNYAFNMPFSSYSNLINPPLNYDRPMPINSSLNNPPGFSLNVPENTFKDVNNSNIIPGAFNPVNQMSPGIIACNDFDAPNVLQNNLAPVLMNKEVREYPIYIDSVDRDLTLYPDPFNYKVTLNANTSSIAPYIDKRFEMVKYIELKKAVLPRLFNLTKVIQPTGTPLYDTLAGLINVNTPVANLPALINSNQPVGVSDTATIVTLTWSPATNPLTEWTIEAIFDFNIQTVYVYNYNNGVVSYYSYQFDTTRDLSYERWILLNIPEIQGVTQNSTDNTIKKGYAVLYSSKDREIYGEFSTSSVVWIYKNSDLKNFNNSFKISFNDPRGNQLMINNLNFNFDLANNPNEQTTINANGTQNIIWRDAAHYIRHPYYYGSQTHLLMKIGIYENDIDKDLFCYTSKRS